MVRITVSETYDLSTKVNKMSLIGIHTPRMEIVKRSFGGLLSQARMYRFHHCDVRLACASVLPADPLQVGVEPGSIAPQDMFNPILYKAVSNQGMNQFELRMHGIGHDPNNSDRFIGQSIDKTDDVVGSTDDFGVYYTLLSNRKGWKVAHPQRGLSMRNLRPYVYERLFNEGDSPSVLGNEPIVLSDPNGNGTITPVSDTQLGTTGSRALRGRPRPMPFLPVSTILPSNVTADGSGAYDAVALDQLPDSKDFNSYCGLIVMPPARLNKFYYRLVVRWYIDLVGIRPYSEIQGFANQASHVSTFYGTDYTIAQTKDDALGMVDVRDTDIEKIMEGA